MTSTTWYKNPPFRIDPHTGIGRPPKVGRDYSPTEPLPGDEAIKREVAERFAAVMARTPSRPEPRDTGEEMQDYFAERAEDMFG